jgi:hypothetical protein
VKNVRIPKIAKVRGVGAIILVDRGFPACLKSSEQDDSMSQP